VTTIGVAIAIPEPFGSELRSHRASFGDVMAEAIPTHLTLLPPSEVDPRQLDVIDDHLGMVASKHAAFFLRMRGTATFRPVSPVVFVAVTEGISSCELLAEDIRSGPLQRELAYPYHPHVTVAHHLDEEALDTASATLADYECEFCVVAFSLYIHGSDNRWRPHQDFKLAPSGDDSR
jgi:2'-5' RNA ligase